MCPPDRLPREPPRASKREPRLASRTAAPTSAATSAAATASAAEEVEFEMEGAIVKRPNECTAAEREAFAKLVREGGQVDPYGLDHRILAADRLIFHYEAAELAAVAGLKNLPLTYRRSLFQGAKSQRLASEFPLEFGWAYVVPAHRGKRISRSLVQTALDAAERRNVYAITEVDNAWMQQSLERYGFTREGAPFPSTVFPDKTIQLFVRLIV